MRERLIPLELFLADCLSDPPIRVPGIAVFLSGNPVGAPPALRHNFNHNHVLHETVIILCVETVDRPHVSFQHRVEVEEIGEGFWRVTARYGFMDKPEVPDAMVGINVPRLRKQLSDSEVTYYPGRETLVPASKSGMGPMRDRLFPWMSRNAQSATSYYRLPPGRVVEIGLQVEM